MAAYAAESFRGEEGLSAVGLGVVKCTGSYGAALARHLRAEGIEVTEVDQPDKAARRRHGKTHAIDAEAAARAVLPRRDALFRAMLRTSPPGPTAPAPAPAPGESA